MSRSRSRLRLSAAGGALAALALTVPSAEAASKTLNLQCKFPLIGNQTVSIGYEYASTAPVGTPTSLVKLTSVSSTPQIDSLGATVTADGTFKSSVSKGDSSIEQQIPFEVPLTAPVPGANIALTEQGAWNLIEKGVHLNVSVRNASGQPVLLTPVTEDSDGDPATFDVDCLPPVGGTPPTIIAVGNGIGPTKPGPITIAPSPDGKSAKVKWGASVDDTGIHGYEVLLNGTVVGEVSGSQTSFDLTGLTANTDYEVEVGAIDTDGYKSPRASATFTTGGVIIDPYGYPTALRQQQTGPTSVDLTWELAGGFAPPSWGVYVDDVKVEELSSDKRKATLSSLTPGVTYSVVVKSLNGDLVIGSSPKFLVTIPTGGTEQSAQFDLTGSASIKTLVKGNVGLSGGLSFDVDEAGAVKGDLSLRNATARLVAGGFLPVTAKLAFVQSGKTTGTYAGTTLKTNTKLRIKVTEAKLFGAIAIAGGNNCQTRQLTDLNLSSDAFSLTTGGTLTGTFALSNLNGCGVLNGLVSPVTAGGGNTITLKAGLVPPPAQQPDQTAPVVRPF